MLICSVLLYRKRAFISITTVSIGVIVVRKIVIGKATGAVTHRISTGSWEGAGQAAIEGAADGYMTGAISGFISGGVSSKYCFITGTPVATHYGLIPIEDISPGDLVWATNPETGQTELKEAVQLFRNETTEWVHVVVNDEKITATPSHPFYSPVKGWTKAIELRAGDILVMLNGEYVVVEQVQHELLESPEITYNFEVEGFHTYYVGEQEVLVHNKCAQHGDLKKNMLKEGPAPGEGYQAHHGLPWAERDYFSSAGLDVNDARFGRWVKGGGNGGHQSWSSRYGQLWKNYIKAHPTPDATDIISYFNKLNGIR